MPLYLFNKTMALFWIFAETVLLFYCRRGILYIQGRDYKQKKFGLFLAGMYLIIAMGAYLEPVYFPDPVQDRDYMEIHFFQVAMWNFFYTSWIILEGIIMMHVYRFLQLMKTARDPLLAASPEIAFNRFRYGVLAFLLIPLSFYGVYLFLYYSVLPHMTAQSIKGLSLLYLKCCGFIWISVEMAVAWLLYRSYSLVKEAPWNS